MPFPGNENHEISFDEWALLTKRYRLEASAESIKALFFGKNAIQQLLDQDGSVGIQIYFGLTEEKLQSVVFVGVSENEDDQIGNGAVFQYQIKLTYHEKSVKKKEICNRKQDACSNI